MARKGKKIISVDFTGVSAEGGRLLPEGEYQFELVEIEEKEGEESGQPYLEFTLEVADGDLKGVKAWDNMSLQPKALWKLRQFMEAGGLETTDGPMEIDPDTLIGTVVTASVFHETYKGKTKHRIGDYVLDNTGTATPPDKGAVRRRPAAEDEPAGDWKKGEKVKFKDGKKTITGTIKQIDGETITVLVKGQGKDIDGEYEMGASEIEAA